MIKEFVEAWHQNKDNLENYFKTTKQENYADYSIIVKQLFELIINPYLTETEGIEYPLCERI